MAYALGVGHIVGPILPDFDVVAAGGICVSQRYLLLFFFSVSTRLAFPVIYFH